ncbi:cell division protein ZapA [Microvirga rosea]|uniref:cell division protein ZapA n=1 Tax=Microvirga rosea TaxID=2715425 RepID=UPI001D0BC6EB|nr:cell division protein ZapA [Microvirga rosea]MCB8822356.1 cell division protein ZapA [Microvirga rosea]
MAQVTVTIAGKTYRIACGDGEEGHLEALAASYDTKIEEMRAAFGEIGEMRLHVMAAITLADEMHETRSRLAATEAELAELRRFASQGDERTQAIESRLAEGVHRAAERIELLARSLNAPGQG